MATEQNNHYNIKLKPFAKTLRNDSTKAEVRMWCELLSKSKMGYSFLRQRPVGDYIVDFMSKELKLIIEVDGYSHQFKTNEDLERDKLLTDLGYTVLRFTDDEVMQDLPNVQRTLEIWITESQR
jgi:very-short-patch-repair endonuclease